MGFCNVTRIHPAHTSSPRRGRGCQVPMESLDRLVERRGLGGRRVSFIKLDIEGFEGRALRGSLKTIRRFKPLLLWRCRSWQVSAREVPPRNSGVSSRTSAIASTSMFRNHRRGYQSSSRTAPHRTTSRYRGDLPTGTAEALGLGTPRRTDTRR